MANLTTKDKDELVREQVTAIQASNNRLVNFTPGSVLLAIVESISTVVVWLESLILQVLGLTRAATSNGVDLDSYYSDFGFTRLAAIYATGNVTFSRFTATTQAVVPIGSIVQTADGLQKYSVVLNADLPSYSSSLGGYVLAPGVANLSLPVQAFNVGAQANAVVGGINALGGPIPNIDTVTNAAAFTNGVDPELDTAYRQRFVGYLASLAKGTKAAILFAVTSISPAVRATITENQTYGGAYQPGYFYVVVDDGSGSPSGNFISNVANAIEAVRPITVTYGVFGPTVITANVAMTITTSSGYNHASVVAIVASAISAVLSKLELGQGLPYTRLAQIAYDSSPGVINVTAVQLNSGTADLTANNKQVIKPGTVTVT